MAFKLKAWSVLRYHNYLSKNHNPIVCPICHVSMLPKYFEKHCFAHQLDSKKCCVWCVGSIQWKYGKKFNYGLHLRECCEKFIKANESCAATEVQEAIDNSSNGVTRQDTVQVPERVLDTSTDFMSLPQALDDFFLLQVEYPLLPFEDESINLARAYVQKYLDTKASFDWIHIIVTVFNYRNFVQALTEDNGMTQTLRFSCWCDSENRSQKDRCHRHMIVVTPKGHFKNTSWSKMILPSNHFFQRSLKKIVSPYHLVKTLGYLSQQKSNCQFIANTPKSLNKNIPWFIFETLPVGYQLALVTQWDNGVLTFLENEKFRKASLEKIIDKPMITDGAQWKQEIGNFYDLERGIILPVKKRFMPTSEQTPYFLYLMNGRKLYFQPDDVNELLNDESWFLKQAQGGNCFYDNIAGELWTPNEKDQQALKLINQHIYRCRDFQYEILSLHEKLKRLTEKGVAWKRKIVELEEENNIINKKVRELYEIERERLQMENERLKNASRM